MPNETTLLDELLTYSSSVNATDLHLCTGSRPLIRVDSMLTEIPDSKVLNPNEIESMFNDILDNQKKSVLSEKGVIDFSFSKNGLGRFRANVYSQRGTYAAAIRMLPIIIPQIADLGLPHSVETFLSKSKGLFLVTGSSGSGKSTTLASLIDMMNKKYRYHIITIEDPIEYLHRHDKSLVTQREIGQDTESFSSALRSALREDPDVIMVGEMRDPETIAIALTAAETGHFVMSTLHTIGAAKSIDRIIDASAPGQQEQVRSQLATVLNGIVSQQLLAREDRHGLVLASEVLIVNPAVRNLIRTGKHYQINSIMQAGQAQGMQLFESDLARLCNAGIISAEEAMLHADDQNLLRQFLGGRNANITV